MNSPECYLGLGLVLGALIGGLLVQGTSRHKAAMGKIRAMPKELEKANEAAKKAREKQKQGLGELPGAYLLILLAIGLLILAAYLLSAGQGF
jgi:Na+/glutamate symporter